MPYTALTMLLTSTPKERDSATAYRECSRQVQLGEAGLAQPPGAQSPCCMLCPRDDLGDGGTLMGATIHGLIVSGAHGSHRCKEDMLPGEVAVSPNAGGGPGLPEPWGPASRSPPSSRNRSPLGLFVWLLGGSALPSRLLASSLLLTLSPCPPFSH